MFAQVPLTSWFTQQMILLPLAKLAPAEEDPLPSADTLRWMGHKTHAFYSVSCCSKHVNMKDKAVHSAGCTGKASNWALGMELEGGFEIMK